jgi:CO/xanthine dehydrogenase FAD-binding subunit
MKLPPVAHARAESVEEAVSLLSDARGGARVLAGGQSLVPLMAFRQVRPDLLVDVNEIAPLGRHSLDDPSAGLVIGANCRQVLLEHWSPPTAWRAFPQAVRQIGNYVTRLRGTAVGSITHADPAGELPLLFVLFGGELSVRSAHGERTISSSDFYFGPHETALSPVELVTEVRFHAPPRGAVSGFAELNERTAVASVGIALGFSDGVCDWCRIALGGVAPTPIRAPDAEAILCGSRVEPGAVQEAARTAAAASAPRSDTHGSARFRRALVQALVERVARGLAVTATTE